jgi:tetratricopeptide (TPR) repeat protein
MTGKWGCVLVLGLGLAGCVKPPLTVPSQGGDAWFEIKSAHFRLVSDLEEPQAYDVVGNLEETYGLLGDAIFRGGKVPSFETNALIFRGHDELRQFVPDDVGGMYMPYLPNDIEPSPTLLAWGSLSPFARLLFTHELTHRFNHVALGSTPAWLNEGIAEYYSTIRGEAGQPVTGEIDPRYSCPPDGLGDLKCYQYERVARDTLPSASEIIGYDREAFYAEATDERGVLSYEQRQRRRRHYSVAWLLVHMLMHAESDYAQRFRALLGERADSSKGQRLADLVGHVPAATLDRDFSAYIGKQIPWRQYHAPTPQLPGRLDRRVLDDSEIWVWWARLDPFDGPHGRRALNHLELATGHAAGDEGSAWFWRGRFASVNDNAARADEYYRRALQLEPGNPSYLYGLLDLHWGHREGADWDAAARSVEVAGIVKALTPVARSAAQLNAVAAHQLLSNDVAGALASSAAACKSSPACWPCFHNHAAVLFASGDATGALAAENEALGRLPETAPAAFARQLQQALGFYAAAAASPDSVSGRPRPGLFAP